MTTALANLQWHNANQQRNYPLDDIASRVDAHGLILPQDLLVDMRVWFPGLPSDWLCVSSLGLTPGLASLTLSDQDGNPVATFCQPRSLRPMVNHRLDAYRDGLIGWVAWGPAVNTTLTGNWRFAAPANAKLHARVAQPFAGAGVMSLRTPGHWRGLEGLVKLTSDSPSELTVTTGRRTIDGEERNCVIVALNTQDPSAGLMRRFAGPCGGTPDSNSCDRPTILTINDATPDCDGIIELDIVEEVNPDLGDLLTVTADAGGSIAWLDYLLGMTDVCDRPTLENLPNQVDNCDDPCDDFST